MSENVKRKLIEVALPLAAINAASAREKSIRHGHPSTLHLWWARRPLAACRAVLFASLVDDPSGHPDQFPTEDEQRIERDRIFRIIERLVQWENSNNNEVLAEAQAEIARSCDGQPPAVLDPFCGGGSIPLEAQRLGLEAHASDLNPVAVLMTKALIEIPPRFAGRPPVHRGSTDLAGTRTWQRAQGLAEDVSHFGAWMRDEAQRRIGHLYPKVALPASHGGGDASVIAWIWCRTIPSPDPAWGGPMPLVRSFVLSTTKNHEAWVDATPDWLSKTIRFEVQYGPDGPKRGTVGRDGARCLATGTAVPLSYIREQGRARRMGVQLMAIVADGPRGRVYLSPTPEHEHVAASLPAPKGAPDTDLPKQALGFRVQGYGITKHRDLFTPRQLTTLVTFSDLISEARGQVLIDALAAGMESGERLSLGGSGAEAYADAVATYLALAMSRLADNTSSLAVWSSGRDQLVHTFGRQTLSMVWDFAEANAFSGAAGDPAVATQSVVRSLGQLPASNEASADQADARQVSLPGGTLVSTDPPYYDNVPYADLSDYFYIWLRRSLQTVYPDTLATVLAPKSSELIADAFRHKDGRDGARRFFEDGMREVFRRIREADTLYPVTVYYAFKQEDVDGDERSSTGWEVMLAALVGAGFTLEASWPVRSERPGRMRANASNALASSIVLVCRPRVPAAPTTSRREFIAALRSELPGALHLLQSAAIAATDLAQAALGPGMATFSRFAQILEANGSPMTVGSALTLINQAVDEILDAQVSELDAETRFATSWFDGHGFQIGEYGEAETLFRAKGTSAGAVQHVAIAVVDRGKVRLLRPMEMEGEGSDGCVWSLTQRLVRAHQGQGERGAAALLDGNATAAEAARDLAYRLYTLCDRKGWAADALPYNALVVAWPEIIKLAARSSVGAPQQMPLVVPS